MTGPDKAPSFTGDPPAAAQQGDLVDRRELALVAVERTRMPMIVCDPRQKDNPIVLANRAFLELTGYQAEEVIGRNCRFLQGPDTAASAVSMIREGLTRGDPYVEVELLNYRKDGSSFWNQVNISPVFNDAHELLYFFGSQKDMTARRRAEILEASERRLLMEIDHRAMNALALVQSIVGLSRADTAAGLLGSISGRVASLARAHRLLAATCWNEVDLLLLVQGQVPVHMWQRVELVGPRLSIQAHIVQSLSLVLHELVSNTLAHGALSDSKGAVQLSWSAGDGGLLLQWVERANRLEQARIEERFGLQIARNVVEQQLGGVLTLDLAAGEFDATIAVPGAIASFDA
jgi:PAS domain S-box-containing protein